jgi:CheY-like chemotaxis protein
MNAGARGRAVWYSIDLAMTNANNQCDAGGGGHRPKNTLRLSAHELSRLQDELDAVGPAGAHPKRVHNRWAFRETLATIEVEHPGGATTELSYACRNISPGGLSVLHSSFMHIGTRVVVRLPRGGTQDGAGPDATIRVPGAVVRCRHLRGTVHEVGVKFDRAVDLREVLSLDPLDGCFMLEHVDPESLRGSVLYVDRSPFDRKLVRHHLRETALSVVAVETPEEAMKRVGEGFDVILTEFNHGGVSGIEFCLELRAAQVRSAIIVTSADTSPETLGLIRGSPADAFLAKPMRPGDLLSALAEFLLLSSSGSARSGGVVSTLPPDDPRAGMLSDFVAETRALAKEVLDALEGGRRAEVRDLLLRVKSCAPAMGFERLAEAADAAASAMKGEGGNAAVRQFAALCERAMAGG